jgi:sortase A
MIRRSGVIFENSRIRYAPQQTRKIISASIKGRDRDSGVGQAPEFLSKPLTHETRFFYSARIFKIIGNALIIFAFLGFLLTYGPILQIELGYRVTRLVEPKQTEPVTAGGFEAVLNKAVMGEIEGVPDPAFSLIIPKIHAKSKIIANVDAASESAYLEALKNGVAHAKGTVLPGNPGNIYLFAHSTDSPLNILRYNAVFYLLRELEINDEVYIYYQGIKHRYLVTDKKIIEPTDISYLSPYSPDQRETVILQTCWPPGTTFKRLLIFAKKT